jgi:hypothetical protein
MKLKELKDWLTTLPNDSDDYEIVNGDLIENENEYQYQIEKPVVALYVDTEHKEIIVLTQPIK